MPVAASWLLVLVALSRATALSRGHSDELEEDSVLWRHTSPKDIDSWPLWDTPSTAIDNEFFGTWPQEGSPSGGWVVANVTRPTLSPFAVPGHSKAAVVVIPGGRGSAIAWESEGTDIARWLKSLGISALVLKYRAPSPSPLANEADVQRAVSLARTNASHVGVLASGHGAAVALRAATAVKRFYEPPGGKEGSFRPDFALLLDPESPQELISPGRVQSYVFNVTRMPPSFVAAAGSPVLDLCRKLSSSTEFHLYDDVEASPGVCLHGRFSGATEACRWLEHARWFLERQVFRSGTDAESGMLYAARRKLLFGG